MKKLAHYIFLAVTVFCGTAYWIVTTGELARQELDHGYLGVISPATGLLAFMLHSVFSYAVLIMCFALVIKEFLVGRMATRVMMNAAGFLVVCIFLGLFEYWELHN